MFQNVLIVELLPYRSKLYKIAQIHKKKLLIYFASGTFAVFIPTIIGGGQQFGNIGFSNVSSLHVLVSLLRTGKHSQSVHLAPRSELCGLRIH